MTIENQLSIDFPLKGEWRILRPPGHHPSAFDFVKMDDDKKKYSKKHKIRYFLNHISADKYYCWDQPIYSPVDGTVMQTGTGCKDHAKTNIWKTIRIWYNATYKFRPEEINGRLDIRPNAGNYVMIKAKDGYIVFLAHLKHASTRIKEGQPIKTGDLIANVGNSGNSTAPHLHINLFDQMEDPLRAKVLPFVFNKYEALNDNNEWVKHTLSVPKVGSFIRFG